MEAPVSTYETDAEAACLRGQRLWGDDFGPAEIEAWYRDEKEAFAELVALPGDRIPTYIYHALNHHHGFRYLPEGGLGNVLGFGSAWGEEFEPVASRIERLTVVDPSDAWDRKEVHGIPTRWVTPTSSGELPFDDASFDVATCLGALHHIPNVSRVVGELARVLKPAGTLVLREPIVSLGDWREPRFGLTRRERGIPLPIFRRIWSEAGFALTHQSLCSFPITTRLEPLLRRHPYLDPRAVTFDAWLSRLFAWNLRYHRRTFVEKLCPTCVYAVLTRV